MKRAIKDVEEFSLAPDLRESYDKEWADINQGKLEGRIEGKKEGKIEGRLGHEKEAVINFHKNGASDELITKSLNITQEKLEEYLKNA